MKAFVWSCGLLLTIICVVASLWLAYAYYVNSRQLTLQEWMDSVNDHSSRRIRSSSCYYLAETGDPRTYKFFLGLLESTEHEWCAADGLAKIGDSSAIPYLFKAIADRRSNRFNRRAVRAIGILGDASHVPELVELRDAVDGNSPKGREDLKEIEAAITQLSNGKDPADQ